MLYFSRTEYVMFCENIYNMHLYAKQHVIMIICWFSGYSYGRFNMDMRLTYCRTWYLELSEGHLQKSSDKNIVIESNYFGYCTRYICSPPQSNITKQCVIKAVSPLGTAKIDIMKTETITPCEKDHVYNNIPSGNSEMVTMAVTFSDWPFSLTNKLMFQWNNLSGHIIKRFDYIHNMTLSLPQLCRQLREQWSAVVLISGCYLENDHIITTVNHIPALTDNCLFVRYDFKPTDKDNVRNGSYHDFFYKDSGHANKGHLVNVDYTDCPIECKTYKYSTFVRSIDMTNIHEYTANVGDLTSTGRYHTGFRVSMLISNESCKSSICNLRLVIQEDFISSKDKIIQNTSVIFHKKR